MTVKGIWKNISKNGQPVELVETQWHGYPNRNGKAYAWQSIETGIIRELLLGCENEEEAIRRTPSTIVIEELFPYHPETVEKGLRFCLAWEPAEDYPNGFPQAYPVSFGKKELICFPNRCGNCENNYTDQRNCPKFS